MARSILVVGHVFVLARENLRSQTGIGVGVAAANCGSDGDFANESRKDAAALGISGGFLVFNRGPF